MQDRRNSLAAQAKPIWQARYEGARLAIMVFLFPSRLARVEFFPPWGEPVRIDGVDVTKEDQRAALLDSVQPSLRPVARRLLVKRIVPDLEWARDCAVVDA